MYVILQLQHSVGDVSNSTSSTVQSLTELVVFFYCFSSVMFQIFLLPKTAGKRHIILPSRLFFGHLYPLLYFLLALATTSLLCSATNRPDHIRSVSNFLPNFKFDLS